MNHEPFRPFLLISILLFFTFHSYSQPDSCNLRISLLTCSRGEELYSSWGHTAIRVTDKNTGTDMVYNYGTFDDTDPGFYLNFTKGLMHYALSVYPFQDFIQEYEFQNRGIIEQALRLSCADKNKIFNALQINNTDANRFYYYYFHTDNCTTRAKEMIVKNISIPVSTNNILPYPGVTFRDIINPYLDLNNQYWGKFGTDLFLGMNMDKKLTNEEAMFLPDYLKKGFDSTQVKQQPLVNQSQIILNWPKAPPGTWFTPFVVFTILLVVIAAVSLGNRAWSRKVLAVFDSLFFLLIGILGSLMLLLWVIRVDTVCRNNLNILWALPTHIAAAFLLHLKKNWLQKYFNVVFWINITLAFTWFFLPQQINNAVAPILLLLIIRSYYYSKKIK